MHTDLYVRHVQMTSTSFYMQRAAVELPEGATDIRRVFLAAPSAIVFTKASSAQQRDDIVTQWQAYAEATQDTHTKALVRDAGGRWLSHCTAKMVEVGVLMHGFLPLKSKPQNTKLLLDLGVDFRPFREEDGRAFVAQWAELKGGRRKSGESPLEFYPTSGPAENPPPTPPMEGGPVSDSVLDVSGSGDTEQPPTSDGGQETGESDDGPILPSWSREEMMTEMLNMRAEMRRMRAERDDRPQAYAPLSQDAILAQQAAMCQTMATSIGSAVAQAMSSSKGGGEGEHADLPPEDRLVKKFLKRIGQGIPVDVTKFSSAARVKLLGLAHAPREILTLGTHVELASNTDPETKIKGTKDPEDIREGVNFLLEKMADEADAAEPLVTPAQHREFARWWRQVQELRGYSHQDRMWLAVCFMKRYMSELGQGTWQQWLDTSIVIREDLRDFIRVMPVRGKAAGSAGGGHAQTTVSGSGSNSSPNKRKSLSAAELVAVRGVQYCDAYQSKQGKCKRQGGGCEYLHQCASCGGDHVAKECPAWDAAKVQVNKLMAKEKAKKLRPN
jgi:hypothetical protein